MSFEAFSNLVLELTPFLQLSCLNPIRSQLETKKIVAIVIYQFAHGFSATHMDLVLMDRLNVSASIIRKYVDIVYDVLIDKDKLFSKYISIPSSQHLNNIITHFENLTCIPKVCGALDRTHILLADLPSKKVTLVISDFFDRKKFHNIVLQLCVMQKKIFWNAFAS
jgi:hypothetical protein